MILKFDLKLVLVDLMSHCWMWSKLNCFIKSVANGDMSEKKKKGNFARFSIKGLMFKKKKFPTMFHKILMDNVTACINGFTPRIHF